MTTALDLLAADSARSRAASALAAPVAKSITAQQFASGADLDGLAAPGRLVAPMAQSTWVMRAITIKTGELANAPIEFYAGEQEYKDAAFSEFWRAPFRAANGGRLSLAQGEAWLATWLDLEGECFLVLDDLWLIGTGRVRQPSPILIAAPARMRHVVRGGELIGWVYTDAAGHQVPLLPEQVIHYALPNPYDLWRGLAPLSPMLNAVESDVAAGIYIRNLMRNNGDQGVYVVAKDGSMLTTEQREQITSVLRAKRAARMRGQFIPTFLGGQIEITDPKAQAPDANLQATRLASRHEIFIGLGVPASMADVQASYSIGSASDRYQLITGTCQPLGRLLCGLLSMLATRTAGRAIEAEHDWDNHQVMQEVRRSRTDVALKLWGTGMPMEKVSEYLDLGLPKYAGWDRGYLPFSVTEVGGADAVPPAADPTLAENPPEDTPEVAQIRALILLRQRSRQEPTCTADSAPVCTCGTGDLVTLADRDPAEIKLWSMIMRVRRQQEKQYKSRLSRVLFDARSEVLRALDGYQPAEKSADGIVAKGAVTDFLFSLEKFTAKLSAAFRSQAALTLQASGNQLYEELGRDDPFTYPSADVLEFVRARENKIGGASKRIHEKIKETLEEGITAGDTQAELAARVKEAFNGLDDGRAITIAQTEAQAAFAQGRQVAMEAAGIEYKQWLTSGNPNTRATHAACNGQVVRIDERFEVPPGSGVYLDHPGDPTGPADEVINCHCVSIPVEKP
jgi:SPP1 gp7 family putative phage head morphogenesis protein